MKILTYFVMFIHVHRGYGRTLHQIIKREVVNESLIIRGEAVHIDDYPFMSHLQIQFRNVKNKVNCGSTILNHYKLLGAAHCFVYFKDLESITINIGSIHPTHGLNYFTKEFTAHSSYHYPQPDYDVAVVTTQSQMYLDKVVTKAVTLPISGTYLNSGLEIIILGWGRTNPEQAVVSPVLRMSRVIVYGTKECEEAYGTSDTTITITDRLACAGQKKLNGQEPCQGDSGGPAIRFGVQVGIMSMSPADCGVEGYPGLYARVGAALIRDWIKTHAGV